MNDATALAKQASPHPKSGKPYVCFMYSYPNYIPLPASEIDSISAAIEPFDFDRIYAAGWDRNLPTDPKSSVRWSAERYKRALGQ